MRTTARPAAVSRRREEPSHRLTDALGIGLIAAALVVAVALAIGNAGIVGEALGGLFRTLFGRGAWAAPPLFALLGVALLAGRRQFEVSRLSAGLLVLFAAILGGLARDLRGDYFDPGQVSVSGGYVGAVAGWLLSTLLGAAKPVGVGAIAMVGFILCVDAPLRHIAAAMAERARRVKRPTRALVNAVADDSKRHALREAVVRMGDREQVAAGADPGATRGPERTRGAPMVRETLRPRTETLESIPKEGYQLPSYALLNAAPGRPKRSAQEMQKNIETLEGTLEEFGIEANVVEVAAGPTITRYEIQLGPGIRVARITALADNIAMNLAASHVRVEAPIPGKAAIGVEVPNAQPSMVTLREVCDDAHFRNHPSRLCVALGQDVGGVNKYADLTKMPHLLIGGATNSGKSIGLATLITSLLMRNTPKDVKFVMIDPKRVELSLFDDVPHLLCPVVKDVKEAPGVLRAVWREMDRRYDRFSEAGVRNIDGWNEKASFADKLPYIVVVIDELADLMIQAAAEVETSICRLAQLARATGIHLVIATQRPSVDVITGTIKANIASRIAFAVSSQIDSRTILDQAGAERLVGKGDLLFLPIDASKPTRIQGCYVAEQEIHAVCEHWRAQETPRYTLAPVSAAEEAGRGGDWHEEEADALWEDAVRWVCDRGQASTSMLQRRFSIGFQRASRLLDSMEERGIVGARDGPRPREVLVEPGRVEDVLRRGSFAGDPVPDFEIEE